MYCLVYTEDVETHIPKMVTFDKKNAEKIQTVLGDRWEIVEVVKL
jgi:hypothetical protein